MAQSLTLPRMLTIRVDQSFLAAIDAALREDETRSQMIRDAALAEAMRRKAEGR